MSNEIRLTEAGTLPVDKAAALQRDAAGFSVAPHNNDKGEPCENPKVTGPGHFLGRNYFSGTCMGCGRPLRTASLTAGPWQAVEETPPVESVV